MPAAAGRISSQVSAFAFQRGTQCPAHHFLCCAMLTVPAAGPTPALPPQGERGLSHSLLPGGGVVVGVMAVSGLGGREGSSSFLSASSAHPVLSPGLHLLRNKLWRHWAQGGSGPQFSRNGAIRGISPETGELRFAPLSPLHPARARGGGSIY